MAVNSNLGTGSLTPETQDEEPLVSKSMMLDLGRVLGQYAGAAAGPNAAPWIGALGSAGSELIKMKQFNAAAAKTQQDKDTEMAALITRLRGGDVNGVVTPKGDLSGADKLTITPEGFDIRGTFGEIGAGDGPVEGSGTSVQTPKVAGDTKSQPSRLGDVGQVPGGGTDTSPFFNVQ